MRPLTFHILAPVPRGQTGNRFYEVGAPRTKKTLCGAGMTGHDIRFGWQAIAIGPYEPCSDCCRIRKATRETQ